MWGNLLGWSISAVMVVATVGGLISLNRSLNQISPPTTFSTTSGALAAIELPSDIDELLTKDAGPANAGALYRQAISEYQANRATFDRFVRSHRRDDLLLIQPTLDVLVQASGNSTVPIFAGTPQDIINYQTETPLTALELLGQCLLSDGLLTNAIDPKRAVDEMDSAFSLGIRLAREQLTYAELSDGLGLMDAAATELATMSAAAHDSTRATNYRRLSATVVDYTNQKLIPIESVLSSIDPAVIDQNAGDIFKIAEDSKSRMWRIEALLALGRYKFNAPTLGDNRGATRVLSQLAEIDADPAIQIAAAAARDLTSAQAQLLH